MVLMELQSGFYMVVMRFQSVFNNFLIGFEKAAVDNASGRDAPARAHLPRPPGGSGIGSERPVPWAINKI